MSTMWHVPDLKDWSICGMNHYFINGEKMLFVSMTRESMAIQAEGKDKDYAIIFTSLASQARQLNKLL